MSNEALPAKESIWVGHMRWQVHVVVTERVVYGRASDLDHLEFVRRLQYLVTDVGRLKHTIAGFETEGRTLIFVDQLRPTPVAKDHLEPNVVMMHVVGDGATFKNPDVTRDESEIGRAHV